MKKGRLLELCSRYAYFDRAFLVQISGESDPAISLSISRWLAEGTLLPLRRGMYALAEHLRKTDICPPRLANDLYPPSYLSDVWALSFHGLIPDVAREYTSATLRRPQSFRNHLGVFSFRHISAKYFWGFETIRVTGVDVRCATPEKALIDHWYGTRGEWTEERMGEMRLQNLERIDEGKLGEAVRRIGKPRIVRAHECLLTEMVEAGW